MRALALLILGLMLYMTAALAQLGQIPIHVVRKPIAASSTLCGLGVSLGSMSQPLTASLGYIGGPSQTVSLGRRC